MAVVSRFPDPAFPIPCHNGPTRPFGGPVALRLRSYLVDVLTAGVAYIGARWTWSGGAGVFDNLLPELGTFALFFFILQFLIRGRRLARRGKA